jgi:S-adenosylmethionine:tRNA ribosyltransferase-isomerase
MHPSRLLINDFHYELPDEYIARFPLAERDDSRLLVFKNENISEDIYRRLAHHLPGNALLVFNNSKVIEARILFQKATGGVIEIFALEPADTYKTISEAMNEKGNVAWKSLIGGASKWKHGQTLRKEISDEDGKFILEARIIDRLPGSFLIAFEWQPSSLSFSAILHKAGLIPVPPYLKRETTSSDKERYQTVFAKQEGSVAAPTAGLHFTESLLASLKEKNITTAYVTLHVGAGTFMPVKATSMGGHEMHAEFLEVDVPLIQSLINKAGNIFPVGTTSLRTIESLYWMGLKCMLNPTITVEALEIKQWEVYDSLMHHHADAVTALDALIDWMQRQGLTRLVIRTSILIAPGYPFKLTSGLITNFHQPQSTLLLLVAALTGEQWRTIYDYALTHQFRFLSYGDGCLLYPVR